MGLDGKFADEQFVAAELPFVVGLIRRDASPFLGLGHGLFRRCKAPVWHDKAGPESLFDYDAFFRAFADVWLTKDTLQMAYIRINDVHPMDYLRVNCTLQQFDEFLDFYGITEGDGMYLAPADRVIIW